MARPSRCGACRRADSEPWLKRFDYPEAAPQRLQAFLQKVVNGGGRIEWEYGLGRGRAGPLLLWPQGVRPNLKCLVLANLKCRAPCQGTAPQRGGGGNPARQLSFQPLC